MNYSEVIEMKVVISKHLYDSAEKSIEEVNALLSRGWTLLSIYTSVTDIDNPAAQTVNYILGIDGYRKANLDFEDGLLPGPPKNAD